MLTEIQQDTVCHAFPSTDIPVEATLLQRLLLQVFHEFPKNLNCPVRAV